MKPILPGYSFRLRLLKYLIIQAVPWLNHFRARAPWPYSVAELRQFPASSWGKQLVAFLDARSFTDFLPNYAEHDAFHTLLEYETDVHGVLRLQAFMLGNHSSSFVGYGLFLLGLVLMPELWPYLRRDYRRGRQSVRVKQWDVSALLTQDLGQVRAMLVT